MTMSISIAEGLTLGQLADASRKGHAVTRSAHIGNIYPSSMAVIAMGIPTVLFDRNLGSRDTNYHPDHVIKGGVRTKVCGADVLMTHAVVNQAAPGFVVGERVADCHMRATLRAFPDAKACTWSAYLRQNEDLVGRIVEVAARVSPELWYRRVDQEGRISRLPQGVLATPNMILGKVHGLDEERAGWVIPNMLNILILSMVDSECADSDVLHHLSGPDMCKYVLRMEQGLSALHTKVAERLGLRRELLLQVHPTADYRLACLRTNKNALDALVGQVLDLQQRMLTHRQELSRVSDSASKAAWGRFFSEERQRRVRELQQVAASCGNAISYDLGQANFLSQHDVAGPDDFYIHPCMHSLAPNEMAQFCQLLRRYVFR